MWVGGIVVAALVAGAEPQPGAAAGAGQEPEATVEQAAAAASTADAGDRAAAQEPERAPEQAPVPAPAPARLAEPAPAGAPLAESAPIVLVRRPWGDGGALERLLEPSGDLVLHAVNAAGTVLSCTKVGTLFALPIVSQDDAAGGEVVQVVRDESGALLRYVVQADGEPRAVALIEPAPAG